MATETTGPAKDGGANAASPPHAGEADTLTVRALARGLSILALFDVDHREWTTDDMAERTGLLRMTTYRMVRTLESAKFLVRDATTNQYHLGPATLAMAYASQRSDEFVAIARPFLESLVEETGESVTLAVEVDGAPVCVDAIDTARPFQRHTAPGRIIGNLASVHGKIFAAFKPEEERAEMLAGPLPQLTPFTVTDPQALAEQFAMIVKHDLAFDDQGLYVSLSAVASPVRDQLGDVVAAIAVVTPIGRYGPKERAQFAAAVQRTAAALSTYLGWNPASTPKTPSTAKGQRSR